jgi:hypothetical protein
MSFDLQTSIDWFFSRAEYSVGRGLIIGKKSKFKKTDSNGWVKVASHHFLIRNGRGPVVWHISAVERLITSQAVAHILYWVIFIGHTNQHLYVHPYSVQLSCQPHDSNPIAVSAIKDSLSPTTIPPAALPPKETPPPDCIVIRTSRTIIQVRKVFRSHRETKMKMRSHPRSSGLLVQRLWIGELHSSTNERSDR